MAAVVEWAVVRKLGVSSPSRSGYLQGHLRLKCLFYCTMFTFISRARRFFFFLSGKVALSFDF